MSEENIKNAYNYIYPYSNLNQEQLDDIFSRACFCEDFNLVKTLLNSPKLSLRPNIHYKLDEPFKFLIDDENLEILQYLILEKNMEKTQDIIDIMQKNENSFTKKIDELFNLRELKQSLSNDLPNNISRDKKIKI